MSVKLYNKINCGLNRIQAVEELWNFSAYLALSEFLFAVAFILKSEIGTSYFPISAENKQTAGDLI